MSSHDDTESYGGRLWPTTEPPEETQPEFAAGSSTGSKTPERPDAHALTEPHEERSPEPTGADSDLPQAVGGRTRRRMTVGILVVMPLLLLGAVMAVRQSEGSAGAPTGEAESDSQPSVPPGSTERSFPAPPGFATALLDDGWVKYTSANKGFSISLPRGWRPAPNTKLAARQLFVAGDRDPSFNPATNGHRPTLLVARSSTRAEVSPRQFFRALGRLIERSPRAVGPVQVDQSHWTGGNSVFQLRWMEVVEGIGEVRFTAYSVMAEGEVTQVILVVPAEHSVQYLAVFDEIGRTFALLE